MSGRSESATSPKQAEHYFVIPRLGLVTLTQCEGYLQKLEQLKGCSCPETPDNLRTCFSIKALRNIAVCGWRLEHRPRTLDAMRKIEEQQPGNDLLIVPAQFGARHAGKTFDQTEKSLEENEFALDALSIWMMLLTNPTRLENYSDMAIECGGEIIKSTKANDSKESAVTFTAWKGKLIVASTYVELNYHNQGIATGFIT